MNYSNHMKQNKVLKSLDELSAELLESEALDIIREQTTPAAHQLVKQETRQIFKKVLTDADVRAYRGWGINE